MRQRQQGVQQQQGSLNQNSMGDLAFGIVDASVPEFDMNRGFAAAITDNGAGDLSLTVSNAQAFDTAAIVQVTPLGAIPTVVAVEVVSTTVLRVRTLTATVVPVIAAADVDYWIRVTPVSPA